MNTIQRLQDWYKAQCNGDWEHQWGVKIDTLDNPGWSVTIALNETPQADKPFQKIDKEISDSDWFLCWKEGNNFRGVGDPSKLESILEHFINFVEARE